MDRLKTKTALITGASRGMGASIARLFHKEGANVVLADVRDDEGKAVAAELGGRAHYVHLDVSSEQDWREAVEQTVGRFGGLNVLVNNAGLYRVRPVMETTTDEFMLLVRVNQLGPFLGMRTCCAAMRAAGGGTVVNLASTAGTEAVMNALAYTATKHAVIGMTRAAALEFAAFGIRVNAVCPGGVATPLLAESFAVPLAEIEKMDVSAVPMRRMGRPDEIAAAALFLASEESSYVTGSAFVVDGGLTAGIYSLASAI